MPLILVCMVTCTTNPSAEQRDWVLYPRDGPMSDFNRGQTAGSKISPVVTTSSASRDQTDMETSPYEDRQSHGLRRRCRHDEAARFAISRTSDRFHTQILGVAYTPKVTVKVFSPVLADECNPSN